MKRITLITGHYGSGKTNFAVNLALRQAAEGKKVTVVDLDIVNPYFRTADFAELFEQNGIHLEKTLYANTSLDIPAISFDLARLAYEEECLIIDVGAMMPVQRHWVDTPKCCVPIRRNWTCGMW